MSRMIDPHSLDEDDVKYVKDRPWLVSEFKDNGWPIEVSGGSDNEPDENGVLPSAVEAYKSLKAKQLDDEIASRNEGRDDDDIIVPDGNTKEAKAYALALDDVDGDGDD